MPTVEKQNIYDQIMGLDMPDNLRCMFKEKEKDLRSSEGLLFGSVFQVAIVALIVALWVSDRSKRQYIENTRLNTDFE